MLKEHQAGASAADLCCRHGISDATFHAWRSKCGGMEVSDDRKLKGLAEENARLKRLPGGVDAGPVDLAGDTSKKLVTPSSRRSPVTWAMKQKGHSQRRACEMVGLEPKTYPYASKRSGNGEVRARLRVLAAARRRLGCRRLHVLLAREGILLNHKRLFRLHRELDRIAGLRGCRPAVIVSDNGTELTSHAILRWQEERSVLWRTAGQSAGAICGCSRMTRTRRGQLGQFPRRAG